MAETTEHPLTAETSRRSSVESGGAGERRPARRGSRRRPHPLLVLAALAVVVGFVAIALGWAGASDTGEVWQQVPFLISGGILGVALIAVGIALAVVFEHREDRKVLLEVVRRLDELEVGIAGEFDELSARLDREQHQDGPNG